MKERLKKQFAYTISILILPVIMFFVLGPLEIYAGNTRDFGLDLKDFFYGFLIAGILVVFIFGLIVSILPKKLNAVITYFIFSFSLCAYIQGLFLNNQLIMSDGSAMDWSGYGKIFILNGIVWLLIFVITLDLFFTMKGWIKLSKYASLFLSLVQLITIVTLLIKVPKFAENGYQLDSKDQFRLSNGDNIIVLVLDRYGNEQFEKVSKEYPEIKECLKDFTYYNNADSRYSNTFPSMTHLMTGIKRDYDNDKWLDTVWFNERTQNFYELLHNDGYTVHLYSPYAATVYGNVENMKGMIDNICPSKLRKNYKLIYSLLEKATIYRYAPFALKPRFEVRSFVYNEMVTSAEPEYKNSEFYNSLITEKLSIDDSLNNIFIVDHILGMHDPYEIDENANKLDGDDLSASPEVLTSITRGLHVILAEYFDQLKALGIYDDATIIVTADHGDYFNAGGIQPILFVKQKGESHAEYQINSSPVSHEDFQGTIMTFIGEDKTPFGTSIYDWKEGDRRERFIDNHTEGIYYTDRNELYKVIEDNHIVY